MKAPCGKKVLPGIFFEYAFAGAIWKGEILVAGIEELEKLDAAEIYSKRLNAKEVRTSKNNGHFKFSIADGTVQSFPQEVKTQWRPARKFGEVSSNRRHNR